MWWSEKLGLQRVKEGLEAAGAIVTAPLAEGAESLADIQTSSSAKL